MSAPPSLTLDRIAAALRRAQDAPSSDFDLDPQFRDNWPVSGTPRPAAVLVPLIAGQQGLEVILTKRASHLSHHPGQIAFPGGKVDAGDADATAAALREAHEEIGLDPANVRIIGPAGQHQTVTNFRITPLVGQVLAPFTPRPEAGEVAEVFRVPLSHLANLTKYRVESRIWAGRRRYYHVVPWGPYYIWGATARILRGLAARISA